MTPGPMNFRGPFMGPVGFRGPIEMTLRNQDVEDGRRLFFFFFWEHIEILRKRWHFSLKIFFFLRSHQNLDKTVAFFPSVLELTNPEIRNFRAGPGPTFGSRRPCLPLLQQSNWILYSCICFPCNKYSITTLLGPSPYATLALLS